MESKRFSKNDEGFICAHCGKAVVPMGKSSRDHCPFCLWSRHVDINPGDRANPCQGDMEPISAVPDTRKGYIIIYRCKKCGQEHRNRAALDIADQPDDIEKLIELTTHQF
ncbi:MAG: RNHCP domain-containing protein [Clostridia bacterium]|nr:RNHCP domain-containing protein [Clostridia bacterium]